MRGTFVIEGQDSPRTYRKGGGEPHTERRDDTRGHKENKPGNFCAKTENEGNAHTRLEELLRQTGVYPGTRDHSHGRERCNQIQSEMTSRKNSTGNLLSEKVPVPATWTSTGTPFLTLCCLQYPRRMQQRWPERHLPPDRGAWAVLALLPRASSPNCRAGPDFSQNLHSKHCPERS